MEYFKCFVNLETQELIYVLLSALNADIGDNKCGSVMVKLAFLITNYSCEIRYRL